MAAEAAENGGRLPVAAGGNPSPEHLSMGAGVYPNSNKLEDSEVEIRNVWAFNLREEMAKMCDIVEDYPFVAMDTEFPGVVARPICPPNSADYAYQSLRCNCDLLRIIQLGLSFSDEHGNFPPGCQCWQFNFKFSLSKDMYAQDSIDLLQSSGIDFALLETDGIDVGDFAEMLISSGLVLVPEIKWVSFHSGYDFGYLLKLLTDVALPQEESRFFELLRLYFPSLYDIKYMMHEVQLHGGLSKLADDLGCDRIGPMHQAGSDALLTLLTFHKLVDTYFNSLVEDRFKGELFGYGSNHTAGYRPQLAVTFAKPTPPLRASSYGGTSTNHSRTPSTLVPSGGMGGANSPSYDPSVQLQSLLTGSGDVGSAGSPGPADDTYDPDSLGGDALDLRLDRPGLDSEGGSSSSASSSGSVGLQHGGGPGLGGLGSMSLGPSASGSNGAASMSLNPNAGGYGGSDGGPHGPLSGSYGSSNGFGSDSLGLGGMGSQGRSATDSGSGPPLSIGGADPYSRRNAGSNGGSGPGRGYNVGVNVNVS